MKFLTPTITCLLTSHMKPYLGEALKSVTSQTRTDAQVLLVDSGRWIGKTDALSKKMEKIYQDYMNHPMIEWIFTGEDENMHKNVCMVGYIFNKVIEEGLIRGKYFCTFYDDDLYRPRFFEKMAGYLDNHPQSMAVMCIEKITEIREDGNVVDAGVIDPQGPLSGENFNCAVDGMQVMLRTKILKRIEKPYLVEDTLNCLVSDGLFLDKVGRVTQVDYLPELLCEHRATPFSTFTPTINRDPQSLEDQIAIYKKIFSKPKAKNQNEKKN